MLEPFWESGRILAPQRVLGAVCGGSSAILQAKLTQHRPKMASSWSLNGQKIDAQTEYSFDAFSHEMVVDFLWVSARKMKPSWHPNGSQNRC